MDFVPSAQPTRSVVYELHLDGELLEQSYDFEDVLKRRRKLGREDRAASVVSHRWERVGAAPNKEGTNERHRWR